MSLFLRHRAPSAVQRGVPPSAYYQMLRGDDEAGVLVDGDSALRHRAVWASVNRIAQTLAMLPVDTIHKEGKRRVQITSPQIVEEPSLRIDAVDWVYQRLVSLLLRGNAWGDVTDNDRTVKALPTRIEIRHPDTVEIRTVAGEIELKVNGEIRKPWPVGDLWHEAAYTLPGSIIGLSPIAYHATLIGAGLAAEKFGAQFFPGGHPTWILKGKTAITQEQADRVKTAWRKATTGKREVAVIGGDWDLTQIQINPEDSMFIDLMRYTAEDIASVYGLDPTDIGATTTGSNQTYANREQRQQDRLTYPIGWWQTKVERNWSKCLPARQVVKFNTAAYLKADTLTRYQAHKIALRNKFTTINRVLALEDQEPFDDPIYDEPGVPGGAPTPIPDPGGNNAP